METRSQQVRTWSMLCHLGALAGLLFWLGSILGPLIIWQIKKNELPEIDEHGKASVNFQLTIFIINIIGRIIIASTVGFGIFWGSPFAGFGGGFGFAGILGIINLVAWILAVIAGVRANNGEFYRYPFSIPFIK
ncbi:MAG: DUF4870 domain-containing protein [Chitinophagaceae bacterium]